MKISCTQENLNQALNIVARVTNKSTTLPILANILMQTKDGRLKLSATDLEMGVTCFIGCKIEAEGEFTVPARLISDYVNSLPNKNIAMSVADSVASLECGKYKASMNGMNSDDFPLIPVIEEEAVVTISAESLRQAVNKTIFSATPDESRPEIAGVFFNFQNGQLITAATDSYRLSEFKVPTKSCKKDFSCIIPVKTLQQLLVILEDKENEVLIYVSENQILFEVQDVSLISRLVEGKYPDYKQIIPKNFKTETVLSTKSFAESIKTASLFSREGANDVKMILEKEKGISLRASASQVGENTIDLAVDVAGEKDEVVFNYKYLLDGLAAVGTEEFIFQTGGSSGPGVIKPKDKNNFTYLVMPIKQ